MFTGLTEFSQHPPAGLGVHKSNLRFMGAHARALINQAYAFGFELFQALLKISNFVGNMMYTGAILFQKLCDG